MRKGIRMAHLFRVSISDEDFEFLKKLAKYDNVSVHTEAEQLLRLQISEEMELQEQIQRGEQ